MEIIRITEENHITETSTNNVKKTDETFKSQEIEEDSNKVTEESLPGPKRAYAHTLHVPPNRKKKQTTFSSTMMMSANPRRKKNTTGGLF